MARITTFGEQPVEFKLDTNSVSQNFNVMPRADMCVTCDKPYSEHPGEKCLFNSKQFVPTDFHDFQARWLSWAHNRTIEDVLVHVVWDLTQVRRGTP